ncbi:hypothetical protein HYH02_010068 [Chlamydomonas schloesseri]|uniref:Uncharacterized protein n=1 Tax=Chlamydomonas schloesseri TaxID=2026947 RepID=A0A835TLU0_9CHLO|nr:hypothetical protein HYH02_010068 [Chlamydomonas schloesseri]|eukprot:KAG2441225.1 hypothetical protein HYH02_010068 [Chlamydomonas schloesseri]
MRVCRPASQVLQGRLFCAGSRLDQATRCLLQPASTGSSGAATCGADAACSYLTAAQLAAALAAAPAAAAYLHLASLASFNEWPLPEGSGACVAKWLTQPDTVAALGRTAAANPAGWLLQPDLVGSGCSSTLRVANISAAPEMARTRAAVAAAAAACQSAGSAGGADGCAAAAAGCDWSGNAGGNSSSDVGTCSVGTPALLDSLFDPTDAWVKAQDQATALCTARTTKSSCAAAGSILVDPARLNTWRDVLADGGADWNLRDGGGAGSMAGGQPPPLLRWVLVAAALVLAGMSAVC